MGVEHGPQPAVGQWVAGEEIRHAADAHAADGGAAKGFHVVAGQNGAGSDFRMVRGEAEWPGLQLSGIRKSKPDALMAFEITRAIGRSVFFQIVRRGAQQKLKRAQCVRHQSRVWQGPATDCNIDAFFDQIDDPVVEVEIQFDLRVEVHEFRQDRQDQMVAHQRHADAQPSPRGATA